MKRAYIILGMKRSGHHAIVHWICHNFPSAIHQNDCCSGWSQGLLIPNKCQGPGGKIVRFGKAKDTAHSENHVFNIEDFDIDKFYHHNMSELKQLKKFNSVKWAIVLRDPYNWIASSLRMGGGAAKQIARRIKLYKKQAKSFEYNSDFISINYNLWISDENYRNNIGRVLELPSYDKGVNMLSTRGGGSSFDKLKMKKNALDMKLTERWKNFLHSTYYKELCSDTELRSIDSQFFNTRIWEKLNG